LQFAFGQDRCQFVALHAGERRPDIGVAQPRQCGPMCIGDGKKPFEILLGVRPAPDR
jgi:hypothetical protein